MVLLYWALAFIVGSAIPQVQTISGLVAAICIMQFTYTFPPLLYVGFYFRLDAAKNEQGDSWWNVSRWVRAIKSSDDANVVVSGDGDGGNGGKRRGVAGVALGSTWYYKVFNVVLFMASLAMACLGMYGSEKSIQQTFQNGGAATSFGCTAPV